MKADSGASKHFVKEIDQTILSSIQHDTNTSVILPNKMELKTNTVGTLPLSSSLTSRASLVNVLPGMTKSSLLSIRQLCNDDCTAIFNKYNLHIYKNDNLILKGDRNRSDGLWDVPVMKKSQEAVNAIIRKDKTKFELAEFLHACAFSPTIPTFQAAIKKQNFVTWPAIHTINFETFIGNKISIYLGHMDQVRSNLQSTKKQSNVGTIFSQVTIHQEKNHLKQSRN